jgi:hypothetical protein
MKRTISWSEESNPASGCGNQSEGYKPKAAKIRSVSYADGHYNKKVKFIENGNT